MTDTEYALELANSFLRRRNPEGSIQPDGGWASNSLRGRSFKDFPIKRVNRTPGSEAGWPFPTRGVSRAPAASERAQSVSASSAFWKRLACERSALARSRPIGDLGEAFLTRGLEMQDTCRLLGVSPAMAPQIPSACRRTRPSPDRRTAQVFGWPWDVAGFASAVDRKPQRRRFAFNVGFAAK